MIILSSDDDQEIPDPFPFPKTYGTNIDVGLITGMENNIINPVLYPPTIIGKMCPSITAKFYTKITNVMSMYKRYPKRYDYDRIARAIVDKYPFLRCPLSGHVSFYYRSIAANQQVYFIGSNCDNLKGQV